MNNLNCPVGDLKKLIGSSPEIDDSDLYSHVSQCTQCQDQLTDLAADQTWWNRAKSGLQGAKINSDCLLIETKSLHQVDTTYVFFDEGTDSAIEEVSVDVPKSIDEFDVIEEIGRGGMGVVFRVFDRSLNRPVAIKVMASQIAEDEQAKKRFKREAKAAASVVHQNVVPIHRISQTKNGTPYIVMALANGPNLRQVVDKDGPLEATDIVRIAIQVASGLNEAHKQGLVHRDIKPANVIFEKEVGKILLTDFGLAFTPEDQSRTRTGFLVGTPSYMSPEQVLGKELDHKSDLYSLGALMYFLAVGHDPFPENNAYETLDKIVKQSPFSITQQNPKFPEILERVIFRLLEKNPNNRIDSAKSLEELLSKILAHFQTPTKNKIPFVRRPSTVRQRWIFWLLLLIGSCTFIGGVSWIAWRLNRDPHQNHFPIHNFSHELQDRLFN